MDNKSLHDISVTPETLKAFGFRNDDAGISSHSVKRIFDYTEKLLTQSYTTDDIWSSVTPQHKILLEVCKSRDEDAFLNLMKKIATTPLVYGFMNYEHFSVLSQNENSRIREAEQFIDKLISLSEYLKIINVFNPEQGIWSIANFSNVGELVKQCFTHNNHLIPPPNSAGGAFGLVTNYGVWCLKDLKSRYTSCRLYDLFCSGKFDEIIEIGSGLGTLPYFFKKIDGSQTPYFIYDLPTVSIMQAYFLMSCLGENQVVLDGEEINENRDAVYLKPFWLLKDHNNDRRILWVNQDSMPEIDRKVLSFYIHKIANTTRGSFFLLIRKLKQVILVEDYKIAFQISRKIITPSRGYIDAETSFARDG